LDARNNLYGISNIAGIYKLANQFSKKRIGSGVAGLSQAGPSLVACLDLA
jgi:hypothetical protein